MSVAPANDSTLAPKAAVFLSYAAADELAIFGIAEKISRCGVGVFLSQACMRAHRELHIHNALSFADEVLVLITPTRADPLKTRSTPAFLEGRSVWLAVGVARTRGIPIRGLLKGVSREEVVEDEAIPIFIRDGRPFDTVESYLAHLLQRIPKARPKTDRRLGLRCDICVCQGGQSTGDVSKFVDQLTYIGIDLHLWKPSSDPAKFDAAVVVVDGQPSEAWPPELVPFLKDFVDLGRPVVLLAPPGAKMPPELPEYLQSASFVECGESDNLSFLQVVWTIVGYRQYELGTDEKPAPRVFISYSWDDDAHKAWVANLAMRLRADGLNVILDQWEVRLGDQLTQFMESAVSGSDFVLIICTPRYKERSTQRRGGAGYEGHIITAESFYYPENQRKFIPVLRFGEWRDTAPPSLLGKDFADLRGEPYHEAEYQNLKNTIRRMLPEAPPIGRGDGAP